MESSKIKISSILLCVLFIFCGHYNLIAQDEYDEYTFEGLNKSKLKTYSEDRAIVFKLSLLFPSVGAEVKLAERFSLDFSGRLGINAGLTGSGTTIGSFYFFPQPVAHLEPKWNYNIKKREKRGKKTDKFSSNFISLHTSMNIKVSNQTFNYLTIGPTWGIQRTIRKIGYFKFKSGLGYRHVFGVPFGSYLPVTPILNVQLGFIF